MLLSFATDLLAEQSFRFILMGMQSEYLAADLRVVNKCPVCRSYAKNDFVPESGPDVYLVQCCRCGVFKINGTFSVMLRGPLRETEFTPDQIANFSSYIRENQHQLFSELDREFVHRIPTPSVAAKATKLLRFIAKEHPYAGQQFEIPGHSAVAQLKMVDDHSEESFPDDDLTMINACKALFPYVAASWSRNGVEFSFLLDNNLITRSLLEKMDSRGGLRITPEGWNYLETLEKPSDESTTAFVAMWFDDSETGTLWKQAIRPAVYDAGYEPVRIDAVEHSNKIDDEIIAKIRACKFLVADFTGQRGGVYFEAGFAMGLGKRVIWCVKNVHLKKVHFDIRQYNFLRWTENDFPAFSKALTERIQADIGKGPIKLDGGGRTTL